MSPASSGTLEVERYIGACLISQNRSQINSSIVQRDQYYGREHYLADIYHGNYLNLDGRFRLQRCNSVEGWAGGMPLISFANHQKRTKRLEHEGGAAGSPKYEDQHSPLARLAVHTQGAPLILTKSHNKKNKLLKNSSPKPNDVSGIGKNGKKCQDKSVSVSAADTVSVASDESSGSANSENCLPRIIKPRKRRKKDRKPLLARSPNQDGFSTDSASPEVEPSSSLVNFPPYVPFNFDVYTHRSVPDNLPFKNIPSLVDQLHILGDIPEIPKLHHSFEEIEDLDDGKDINGNQTTTTCQCRYCDPSGLIWDVERSCYSPFLTAPNHGDIFKFSEITLDHLLHSSSSSDYIIDGMSSLSLNSECDVKKSDSDQGFMNLPRSSSDLEVSTEIVTSLNGHRDLEIKFFSSPSIDNTRIPSKLHLNQASYDNQDADCAKPCC